MIIRQLKCYYNIGYGIRISRKNWIDQIQNFKSSYRSYGHLANFEMNSQIIIIY